MTSNRSILTFAILAVTLGLAPYKPEPHLFGKIRWVMGGGEGMQFIDYWDLFMHGAPWVLLIAALIMRFTSKSKKVDIAEILQDPNVNIIDVREPQETKSGMVKGAINMPLSTFDTYIPEIKKMNGPIVLHCKSGMRSGNAKARCQKAGIENVYNGGGYSQVLRYLED